MIYLLDDKKTRQKDFGWSEEKFANYSSHIKPIYTIHEVNELGENLYADENILLYHESFLDFTPERNKAVEQRNKLLNRAESNNNLFVALFSGSQSSRSINQNIAHLPVSILYQNLEILIHEYSKSNVNLNNLLFGVNPEIEERLNQILIQANRLIDKESAMIPGKNLFFRPTINYIQNAIDGAIEAKLFNDVSDEKLSEKINQWLNEYEYDNIFIPLCFGPTLSDFNGLRLATLIRCSPTPNQLKRIFIYSFVGIDYLFQNEFFNILKTKNVQLIEYRKKAFQESANSVVFPLEIDELPHELAKLKLDPPMTYEDTHSIANEWAIYQWARSIGAEESEELNTVFKKIKFNLYFQYLKTLYPISTLNQLQKEQLQIKYDGKPKVLLIDDESEKGWYEIFAYLLGDLNGVYIDYLGEDFKNLSNSQIIEKSLQKIKADDIDIVILDFRLNRYDFDEITVQEISSIQLLKQIKKLNPGIQVVIFSATNKVWNLQALQEFGANGFVLKESPENSVNAQFTYKNITAFKRNFIEASKRIFLKDFYSSLFQIEKNIKACDYEDDSEFEDFLKDLKYQLIIIGQSGKEINLNASITLDVVFLNCFNFIEKFKHFYLQEKNYRFYLGRGEIPLNRYTYKKGSIVGNDKFLKNSEFDNPSWFQCIAGLLVDYFQIIDKTDPVIKLLWLIKDYRNKYIHEKKLSFSQSEILKVSELMVKLTLSMKE
jgi:CheY-like chemotaxis protein